MMLAEGDCLPVEPEVCSTNSGSFLASAKLFFLYGYSCTSPTSSSCDNEGKVIIRSFLFLRMTGMHGACGSVITSFVHFNRSKRERCASSLFLGDGRKTFFGVSSKTTSKQSYHTLYPALIPATIMIEYLGSLAPMKARVSKVLLSPICCLIKDAV
jgi:hypothetical protein